MNGGESLGPWLESEFFFEIRFLFVELLLLRLTLLREGPLHFLTGLFQRTAGPVSYTHLRAHETVLDLVCRLLLEKKKPYTTHHNDCFTALT